MIRAGAAEEAAAVRRAPRLSSDQPLAPFLTRRGRFAARDPLESRPVPSLARWLGVVGWAAFVGIALRRARN